METSKSTTTHTTIALTEVKATCMLKSRHENITQPNFSCLCQDKPLSLQVRSHKSSLQTENSTYTCLAGSALLPFHREIHVLYQSTSVSASKLRRLDFIQTHSL